MSRETVEQQLSFQEQAKQQVLSLLKELGEPISPEKLVTLVAKDLDCASPEDTVKRAVWSLMADGAAKFTPQNEILLSV